MSSQAASALFVLFILWLFTRDRALRPSCSVALWIPTIWVAIIASRPISVWMGSESGAIDADEGSPLDRVVYLVLIAAAFLVLRKRKINWSNAFARNRWVFFYFIYLGISVVWADEPFVSFKRWIKETGNLMMVFVVLSEVDPVEAIKSILFRCASVLIPMSVLYIKYYPEMGRYLDRWTWEYSYGGITTDKNMLGMSLYLSGLGLCWSFLDLWPKRSKLWKDVAGQLLLILMSLWLWAKAHSATSLACSLIGAGMLIGMKLPAFRNVVARMNFAGFIVGLVLILAVSVVFNPLELAMQSLGRNATLTGRTDIWQEVLKVDIDPLIGTGYCSFWSKNRAEKVSDNLGYFFTLKEAHDGYLDVYLNSGFVGLGIVLIMLFTAVRKISGGLMAGGSYGAFRFSVLIGAMFYNITESALSGLVTLWIMLLFALVEIPHSRSPVLVKEPGAVPAAA